MENSLAILKKLNIELPYDLTIPLLDMYPKKFKTGTKSSTCANMITATLLQQPKGTSSPDTCQWIMPKQNSQSP